MKPLHALLALTFYQTKKADASTNTSTLIDFSTAWQECSFYNSTDRWMICYDGGIFCPFVNQTEILDMFWELGCMLCPEDGQGCQSAVDDFIQTYADAGLAPAIVSTLKDNMLTTCTRACEAAVDGETCSESNPCAPGSSFCDYSLGNTGSCQACPLDVNQCYQEGYLNTEIEKRECVKCSLDCLSNPVSELIANGKNISSISIASIMADTVNLNGSGALIDCSDLILHDVEICSGATGKVCLVHDYTLDTLYWQLTDKAESSGCTAIILFGNYRDVPQYEPCTAQHSFDHIGIPFVCVSYNDGKLLLNNIDPESMAEVHAGYLGLLCSPESIIQRCSNTIPCNSDNEFCNFGRKVENGVYVEGWCTACPEDPLHCYFDPSGGQPRHPEFVKSCFETCGAEIYFNNCKFCPSALTGSSLMEGHLDVLSGNRQCRFCPNDDVLYPHREFYMFGAELECWQMQSFFERIKYSENSLNCRLAQSFNYICGCNGSGYAGASTDAKKAALVWMPRIMAILSIMGSSFIIYDAMRIHTRRSKLLYQLLITLSIFDIIGSIAYAFTSLPTPVQDYIYGSKGNDATCTAQGFFIQIGTTACFINSSLSSYYYLTIIRGLSEETLKKKRLAFFIPPILTGLVFAFVGIPWYGDMLIWCNNTGNYWPEIPVILSIAWATLVMGAVCMGVIQTEKKSRRYSTHAQTNSISTLVVKQSFLFVGAFYICWVPYLALQYVWATGRAFTSYGFVLYAASSVPMQGLLNCIVYIKPRYFRRGSMASTSRNATTWFSCSWFSRCCKKKAPQTTNLNKLDDKGSSELQSTAKLTKPPDNDASDVQNSESDMHQSALNSSMLGERISLNQSVNDDKVTEVTGNDDELCDPQRDESNKSALRESVLKSSMLGENI